MTEPIDVSSRVRIPSGAIEMQATRASGPGGQNVNKVATKVEIAVAIDDIVGLTGPQKERLRAAAGSRLSADGRILVTSQLTRSQSANLDDAREKIRALVASALPAPKRRVPTKPSRRAKERRLTEKRHAADRKADRRWKGD